MNKRTVTINGKEYDAHTGMPVVSEKTQATTTSPQQSGAHAMHHVTQRSQTLNRQIVKKAARKQPTTQKSPAISKFAPHPDGITPKRMMLDIGPVNHPIAAKAQQHQEKVMAQKTARTQSKPVPKPAQVIKQEAIADALQKAPNHQTDTHPGITKKYPRRLGVASAALALLLLGGYFTYLNMPSLSVRVAAAQAGVDASYPTYRPDGYSLSGPVAYTEGKVMMKFAANAGPQNFTVSQEKSSWDSSAVLDNYVQDKAGENYITYNERGLTIYTFGGDAAWVNGGILYTINGDAPLSSDQVRRIATSL